MKNCNAYPATCAAYEVDFDSDLKTSLEESAVSTEMYKGRAS